MLKREARTNGETMYYRMLGQGGVMAKAHRSMAIKQSGNPEFLKDVLTKETDPELRALADKCLKELGGFLNFLFDDDEKNPS